LFYAFLRDGDIWTVCQGKRERIHVRRKISAFAISADGLHLAYLEPLGSRPMAGAGGRLVVVSLEDGFKETSRRIRSNELLATCGTIVADWRMVWKPGWNPLDVLMDKPLALPRDNVFRCIQTGELLRLEHNLGSA